ncbi:hypothetical protein Tsp_02899, partial [Trichinella spiralis]|uniref:hypothetical protein n=1 Tax=Trichinella spiralis TaxID=6334 RepID=UPI0001EFCB95
MKIFSECPSFMHWNSLSRWSRQRVVNSTIINSEKIKKLASPTPLKSNGELVKSNRNSLGLNQEAVCNTLNSREII